VIDFTDTAFSRICDKQISGGIDANAKRQTQTGTGGWARIPSGIAIASYGRDDLAEMIDPPDTAIVGVAR
jgi:hypothetical protein